MLDSVVKSYAMRSAAAAVLALLVAAPLLLSETSNARQTPLKPLGRATLTGHAQAIDGDTLLVGGIRVRLEGIDAPEIEQTCTAADGRQWPCGGDALRALSRLVSREITQCEERGLDKYKRLLGVCTSGGVDINGELVRRGLAWAFTRYSQSYVAIEAEARKAKVGIWGGNAQPAWDYRSQRWQSAEGDAPAGCPIKGNVTANGRIYHLPWSPWYDRVRMDAGKGKRWFCTEAEAIAAGWRPAHIN